MKVSICIRKWIAGDISAARVIIMAIDLLNSHMLIDALTLTAWSANTSRRPAAQPKPLPWLLVIGLLVVIILSVAGAVTALGDTLFPAGSLEAGIREDFSPTAHFLVRLRVLHPVIAIFTGLYLSLQHAPDHPFYSK